MLDVGAADLLNYHLFPAGTYTAADIDEGRLARALAQHPEAQGQVLDITQPVADTAQHLISALVVCTEVIGVNELFDNAAAREALHNCAALVDRRGTLIINIGPAAHLNPIDVESTLGPLFERISITEYGRFREPVDRQLSRALALVMHVVRPLRGRGCMYVVAQGRREDI